MYKESVAAYAGYSWVMASMGLRATIEAVCNHLEISGNSLQKRIDLLFKGGFISSSDKKRLHAIRFLGNDAAHEIRKPLRSELGVALEIVEHLIKAVFILEARAQGLHTSIENLSDLVPVLRECATKVDHESSHSLTGILGKHLRRLATDLPTLEEELIAKINLGQVDFLALDSVQDVDGKQVQFYKPKKAATGFDEMDDEIPF